MTHNNLLDLVVYRRAVELSARIHNFKFAHRRVPGLAAQLKRATASISANIAEGYDKSPREFAARLKVAVGESREAQHHLFFAVQMDAIVHGDHEWAANELVELRKMLFGLLKHLGRKISAA